VIDIEFKVCTKIFCQINYNKTVSVDQWYVYSTTDNVE
jgi:hypothetical protein